MVVDFYENNTIKEVDKITTFWSDTRYIYFGWMYKNNEIIGDFSTPDCMEIEKTFSHLSINWN